MKYYFFKGLIVFIFLLSGRLMAETPVYLNSEYPVSDRIEDLINRMTLEDKVGQLSGYGYSENEFGDPNALTFGTPDNERLKIPGFKMGHGPHGIRVGRDHSIKGTYFPVSIAMASTWEPDWPKKVGQAIAKELRAHDHHINLSPTVNIIRNPLGGRTFESYSEDPYLSAQMGVAFVKGNQSQKIISCAKHYVCNNQEHSRFDFNSIVDERPLHEIYLPAFKACIQDGGALTVMGAYNRLNGTFCCENKYILTDILKNAWNFQGFVLSDFGKAVHSTVESALAGLDVEMNSTKYFGDKLVQAVRSGQVPENVLDEMVRRVLVAKYWLGMFDGRTSFDDDLVHCQAHQDLSYTVATKAMVLLKNEGVLPLDRSKISSLAVIGPNADRWLNYDEDKFPYYLQGGGSARMYPFKGAVVSPLQGIRHKLDDESIEISFSRGCPPPRKEKYLEDITAADINQMLTDAVDKAKSADAVVLVMGLSGEVESEGWDRKYLHLPKVQTDLIKKVAAVNPNCAVVLIGGSAITMGDWIDATPAVLMAWYPGEKAGHAIADVLFGDVNPGGKLPLTFPRVLEQYPESTHTWGTESRYKEGVFVGYRYFDQQDINPLFPFGHGKSYTTFRYSGLTCKISKISTGISVRITLEIENTGNRVGDEIVQIYVSPKDSGIERPIQELKAFKRIRVEPGKRQPVTLELDASAFSYYSVDQGGFVMDTGRYEILAGGSSRDIRLRQMISIED
jgi:beta-glucosidase